MHCATMHAQVRISLRCANHPLASRRDNHLSTVELMSMQPEKKIISQASWGHADLQLVSREIHASADQSRQRDESAATGRNGRPVPHRHLVSKIEYIYRASSIGCCQCSPLRASPLALASWRVSMTYPLVPAARIQFKSFSSSRQRVLFGPTSGWPHRIIAVWNNKRLI